MASHPISHDEQIMLIENEIAVLVVLTLQTHVRQARGNDTHPMRGVRFTHAETSESYR
jgi:hypothetical protein